MSVCIRASLEQQGGWYRELVEMGDVGTLDFFAGEKIPGSYDLVRSVRTHTTYFLTRI